MFRACRPYLRLALALPLTVFPSPSTPSSTTVIDLGFCHPQFLRPFLLHRTGGLMYATQAHGSRRGGSGRGGHASRGVADGNVPPTSDASTAAAAGSQPSTAPGPEDSSAAAAPEGASTTAGPENTPVQQDTFRFMDLPMELRRKVMRYLLPDGGITRVTSGKSHWAVRYRPTPSNA